MRLFVTLALSDKTVQAIEEWQKPLKGKYPSLRWTCESQFHVTLRFLGDRDPDQVACEIRALSLEDLLPAEYTLSKIGQFGNPPSVLWLSGKFSSEVFSIARRLDSIPDGDGNAGGSRCFTPHITIARVRGGTQCPTFSFNGEITGIGNAIHLINSRLTPSGHVYSTLFSI